MGTYKSLVYNFGSEAGFFSEFNNMVLALLYCEKNKVVFKLFSTGSKLSDDLWNDFFQPFCMQARNRLNARFNDRQPDFIPDNKIFKYGSALLRFMQNGYLTYDLWQRFRLPSFAKESFLIDGENLTLPDAGKAIINRIWIFNPQTKTEIQKRMNTVDLPSEYVGLHIRRGDKTTEIKNTGYSSYFSKLTSLTDCKNLFIATDDYSVVDDIALLYPQYSIFSMASSLDRGYDHSTFVSLDSIKKENHFYNFLLKLKFFQLQN